MNRVRVKICGITRPQDAVVAASAGVDAIGMVFYPESGRYVRPEVANAIIGELPPFITTVGLFVDATREYINTVLSKVSLDMLQFHGSETQSDCQGYSRPWLKAVRMKDGVNLSQQIELYDKSSGLLLDTYVAGMAGGTGQTFDWSIIPTVSSKPLILAGGLNPENVQEAIRQVRPYAVDVSGGVESSMGIKDKDKLIKFVQQVRDCSNE